jgi:hypothetical protein
MDRGSSAQAPATLRVLALREVAFPGTGAQHLPACGYFKTFGRGFFGLNAFGASHKLFNFLRKERAI